VNCQNDVWLVSTKITRRASRDFNEFKFLFWRQSSNVTGKFIQVINSNSLLKEKSVHQRNGHCFPQKKMCGWLTATMLH
jgi:hypothetical protein